MKKLIFCVMVTFAALNAFCKPDDVLYVGIKETKLKDGTGIFAKPTFTMYYGDVVVVIVEQGSWTQIRSQNNASVKGWIPASSLTKKKIVTGNSTSASTSGLSLAGKASVSANPDDLALAGKTISPETEKSFKTDNPEKRYDLVDQVEKISVIESKLQTFISGGKLNGGAK